MITASNELGFVAQTAEEWQKLLELGTIYRNNGWDVKEYPLIKTIKFVKIIEGYNV